MLFFFTFFNQRILKKKIPGPPKIWSSTTVSNIDYKSVYQNDFWRSCDAEDWSNDAENITRIKYVLKYIHIENSYFKLLKYFTK